MDWISRSEIFLVDILFVSVCLCTLSISKERISYVCSIKEYLVFGDIYKVYLLNYFLKYFYYIFSIELS